MSDKKKDYIVVFAYTKEAGGYEGIVVWTCFSSKEDFEKWYTEDLKKYKRVIAEGVTAERAVELVRQTPRACRIAAALQEATERETGEVNEDTFQAKLKTMIMAEIL
jgi:hypothetical protein